uniref:Uncharacterized protein n=1 Tax=Romanomermis culicivorax TaxID=13658 RepID=A0A915HR32_ROMCU
MRNLASNRSKNRVFCPENAINLKISHKIFENAQNFLRRFFRRKKRRYKIEIGGENPRLSSSDSITEKVEKRRRVASPIDYSKPDVDISTFSTRNPQNDRKSEEVQFT